jgi:hypothetical protein
MHYTVMTVVALGAMVGTAGMASAQFQGQPFQSSPFPGFQNQGFQNQVGPFAPQGQFNQTVMPNVFNPANQPLSPYLNLLRGGNAGVNYYYGVRPGTVGGTGFGIGAPFTAAGGNRMLFFPQLAMAPDPSQTSETGAGSVLAPAGHPVVFNNTLGFFPSPYGNRGGSRPGLAGIGARPQQQMRR